MSKKLSSTITKEERLCKIVWNSNNWIQPCERQWSPSKKDKDNDGAENKGWEQTHGFVHEDWLFNPVFQVNGYQYGYIRGIGILNPSIKKIDTVNLFTINPNTKERFYVGKLYDVETIQSDEVTSQVKKTIKSYHLDMVNQLRNCGADYKNLKAVPYLPNLRFRINSKEIFPNPLLIVNSWFDKKYFRTMPIKMNKELRLLFADLEKQNEFIFIPSSPAGKSNNYVRHTKEGKKNVNQLHLEIEQELYRYLLENGISKNNIACDTLSFGGKLADIVTKNNANSYSIFEIKTDPDFRRGLREAIGQLIDYSTWENSISVNKITAVLLQTNLSENLRKFILRVKRNLIINFDVMLYDRDKKVFSII